mgnify:CR=1 FL=1
MEAILTPPEALRLCRERAGLSQLDLIHKWRLRRPNQISRIENGHEIPNAKLAAKIAATFPGIPADSWKTVLEAEAA